MKILVPIKRVVDYNIKVHVKSDGSGVELNNVKMSMNPFDEIAVEEALRLKESGAKEIIAISIGSRKSEDILRNALAMGVDRAILIESNENIEPLAVAKLLREVVKEEQPQIVITGKQAIDDEACQTGQALAALMGWPQATFASKVKLYHDRAIITREVDGGTNTIRVNLPAVITAELNLNEPRYTLLSNIMKAKKKPIERKLSTDFPVDLMPRLKIIKSEEPQINRTNIRINSVVELLEKLKTESNIFKT